MGGQEGSRGYLFQAVISAFNSLTDDKWNYVQIEPITKDEKVDISWDYSNSQKKVVQVKSSINPFSKGDIVSWVSDLYNDTNDAMSYEIILIGTVSDSVQEAIKKSNSNIESLDSSFDPISDKLKITVKNFDSDSLKSNVSTYLNKFITDKGFSADYYTIDKIADSIVLQFLFFSITGTKISRSTFEESILEWLKFNFATIFGKVYNNRLEVSFYSPMEKVFLKEMSEVRFENISDLQIVTDESDYIKRLIKEIEVFQIITSIIPTKNSLLTNLESTRITTNDWIKVDYCSDDKNIIISLIKKHFNKNVKEDFFDLGNLAQSNISLVSPFIENKTEYKGTDSEKMKKTKLDELSMKLIGLEDLCVFLKQFENFQIIPLALQNIGGVHDEKIRVLLKFPNSVSVLKHEEIAPPFVLSNLSLFLDNLCILESILKCPTDSNVNEYYYSYPSTFYNPLVLMDSEQKKIEDKTSEFFSVVSSIFNYSLLESNDSQQIFEFNFQDLNPKENNLFPSYLFVNSENDFSIQYEISSKNLSEKVVGELHYKIKNH